MYRDRVLLEISSLYSRVGQKDENGLPFASIQIGEILIQQQRKLGTKTYKLWSGYLPFSEREAGMFIDVYNNRNQLKISAQERVFEFNQEMRNKLEILNEAIKANKIIEDDPNYILQLAEQYIGTGVKPNPVILKKAIRNYLSTMSDQIVIRSCEKGDYGPEEVFGWIVKTMKEN